MIAEEFKKRRLALGLTQEQLANEAECHKRTILKLENGQTERHGLVTYRIEKTLTRLENGE